MSDKEVNPAVQTFTHKVEQALNGNNVAEDITKAVWDMLSELVPALELPTT